MRFRTERGRRRWATLVGTLLAAAVVAAPAEAGSMKQWVCFTDAGVAAHNTVGWSGANHGVTGANVYPDCDNVNGGRLLIDMTNVPMGLGPSLGASWTYTAPAGTTINTAALRLAGVIRGNQDNGASMGIVMFRGGQAYDSDHVLGQCQYYAGCSTVTPPADQKVEYPVKSNVFVLWMGCGSGVNAGCAGGDRGYASVRNGWFDLVDDSPPTITAPNGTVMQDGPLRGAETFGFSASDIGVGVSELEVKIDGTVVVQRQRIDNNGGKCIPVEGGYLWPVPCKASVTTSMSIDTTKVADGAHILTATAWDAAGNATTVISRRVTVANVIPSTELVPNNGTGGDPSTGALVPSRKRKSTRINHGATVRVEGHVLDAAGRPLAGAQVDVFEQVAMKGAVVRPVASILTDEKGGYSYKAAPGSSRRIELRYSRQRGASGYQSTHELAVAVRAKVTLQADRTSIPAYGTVRLRGRVIVDDLPKDGTLVQIRARDGGRWLKVGTPRTNAKGQFSWKWKFKRVRRGAVTFQVRLLRTGDLPAETNVSRGVRVRIG